MKYILASASPRRKDLLKEVVDVFEVVPANTDEVLNLNNGIYKAIEDIALEKALDISVSYPNDITIGADTVVYCDNEVMLKPVDFEDAFRILKKLSVSKQSVITGVAICKDTCCKTFYEETVIEFQNMDDEWIAHYINTNKPFDKSGSYGIQEIDSKYIKSILGDITNVIGLPVERLKVELKNYEE